MATNQVSMVNPTSAVNMIDPGMSVNIADLQRRQAMAQMLQQQSMQPQELQMVSGHAVPFSNVQGLARLLQAFGARKMNEQNDAEAQKLSSSYQQRLASLLGGGGASPEGSGDASGAPASGSSSGGGSPFNMAALLRGQAIAGIGGDKAAEAYWADQKRTELQKNMTAMGQNPELMGQLGIAEARKKGILELQPGTTAVNLQTGGERFQPKVGEGQAILPNGAIGNIPGYTDAIGSAEYAKQYPRAALTPYKIDAASGPILSNEAVASGATPPGGGRIVGDFQGDPQKILQQIASIPDPKMRNEALQAYVNNNQPGASKGIPLQDDTSRKFGETIAAKSGDDLLSSRDKAKTAVDTLQGIDQARAAIKSGAFQGSGADAKLAITKFINANVPGVSIDPAKAGNTDYLKSVLGAGLLEQAKALGSNPSNADANRINDIVGAIDKDPRAMEKILDWRQEMAEQSIKRHNATVQDAETRGMKSPYDLRVNAPAMATSSSSPAKNRTVTVDW